MRNAEAVSIGEGWSAHLKMGFRTGAGRTLLSQRERHGPLAVQRPFYPEGDVCHVYLLHPPGGVVGGDHLHIDTSLEQGSHALVTTPGATKFYRSAGEVAVQEQHLAIADGCSLEWMPQENIFFPGARLSMRTRVELQGGARLAFWEIHCLGRPVIAESFDEGHLDSRLEIYREGKPLLLERLRVDPGSRLRKSVLAGRPVSATQVFSGAGEAELLQARQVLAAEADGTFAATLVEDLLLVRYLGDSTEQARNRFIQIWSVLREPLLQRSPSTPRIWNT